MVVDVFGRIHLLKSGYLGSQNDIYTYTKSGIANMMNSGQFLLADGGFSGQSTLITSYKDNSKDGSWELFAPKPTLEFFNMDFRSSRKFIESSPLMPCNIAVLCYRMCIWTCS